MSVRRVRFLFIAYGVGLGFFMPWNVFQLTEAGLPVEAIGLVLGAAALLSLIAYPAWGLIADTLLGRDRTLMLSGLLAALAGAGIVLFADTPALLGVSVVAASVCVAPWAPVADALALTAIGGRARSYGRLRVWVSVGWIVSALSAGFLYAAAGPQPVRLLFIAASLALVATLAVRRPRSALLGRPERSQGDRLTRHALRAALRASPVFLPFLAALFVSSVATNAAYAFISLRILDEGGGPVLVAIAVTMPAVAEIPIFASIGRLSERFGLRALFVAGCLLSAVQVLVIAVAPQPAIIALVRLIDGIGFGLRYSSIVLIAGAALPERLRATGQSMASLITGGIAPIVSGPMGGWIYGAFGGAALFAMCAALLGAASAMAWSVLRPLDAARRAAAVAPVAPLPAPAGGPTDP